MLNLVDKEFRRKAMKAQDYPNGSNIFDKN